MLLGSFISTAILGAIWWVTQEDEARAYGSASQTSFGGVDDVFYGGGGGSGGRWQPGAAIRPTTSWSEWFGLSRGLGPSPAVGALADLDQLQDQQRQRHAAGLPRLDQPLRAREDCAPPAGAAVEAYPHLRPHSFAPPRYIAGRPGDRGRDDCFP